MFPGIHLLPMAYIQTLPSSRLFASRLPLCKFNLPSLTSSKLCLRMDSPAGSAASNDSAAVPSPSENNNPDPLIQYIVLRRDLIDTWPLGSTVSQGCHASVAAIASFKDDPHTVQYCSPSNLNGMRKVTVEVKNETQMVNFSEKLKSSGIDHKLWIEQPENIPTCIATKPYPKSVVSPIFKKLKLCK